VDVRAFAFGAGRSASDRGLGFEGLDDLDGVLGLLVGGGGG
jgi:hypothetical protein